MPNVTDYPLDGFKKWLTDERKRGVVTANQYASLVRRALRACGGTPPTQTALEEVEASSPAASRPMFRVAWRAFAEFASARGREVPTLPDRRHVEPLPTPPIAFHLLDFTKTVPLHLVPDLRWGNLRGTGGDEVEVYHPAGGYVWRVPLALYQTLKAEVKPANALAPLIPSSADPQQPMPLPRLRLLVERATVERAGRST